MKRKIGLALAVILVGVFVVVYAQAKGEKVEPASTPVSSSISASSAPVATEEPAASTEPTAGDGVEDEPVAQETEESPTNEGATYEADAEFDQKFSAEAEKAMQGYIDRGHTREEAEAWWQDRVEAGQQAAAEEQQRIQDRQDAYEEFAKEDAQRVKEEADSYYMERYGITLDQAMGMPSEELYKLFVQKHGG